MITNRKHKETDATLSPLMPKDYFALLELIKRVLVFDSPVDLLLRGVFRDNRHLSSIHKSIIAETLYGLLRNYYKLTTVTDKNNLHQLIGLVWTKILQLPASFYSSSKYKTKFNINYTALKETQFADDILSTTELPKFILDELLKHYTHKEVLAVAQAMQDRAGLNLRVNILKTNVKAVFDQLRQEGFSPQLTQFSPYAIRLTEHANLAKHKLFLQGCLEVQDESSQLAAMLLNPKRGDMLVDFCAGGGGKTLALGMLMRNTGRIYAFDINERRLNNLAPRLQRSGLSNVHTQIITNENDAKIKRLYGKIDRVFVDAPCSGLGTLRRNPELKFRQTESYLTELNLKQQSILNQAAKLLKPQGYLVYATCSILYAENQAIINEFLVNHPEFKLVPANSVLHIPKLHREDGFLVLLPHLHGTDGFFAALLQKTI